MKAKELLECVKESALLKQRLLCEEWLAREEAEAAAKAPKLAVPKLPPKLDVPKLVFKAVYGFAHHFWVQRVKAKAEATAIALRAEEERAAHQAVGQALGARKLKKWWRSSRKMLQKETAERNCNHIEEQWKKMQEEASKPKAMKRTILDSLRTSAPQPIPNKFAEGVLRGWLARYAHLGTEAELMHKWKAQKEKKMQEWSSCRKNRMRRKIDESMEKLHHEHNPQEDW